MRDETTKLYHFGRESVADWSGITPVIVNERVPENSIWTMDEFGNICYVIQNVNGLLRVFDFPQPHPEEPLIP
jgi:hypothetical protein